MALYTGKGDGGTTKAFDSKERIPKSAPLPECLGTLDEVNSFIGLAKARARTHPEFSMLVGKKRRPAVEVLRAVQETLFIVQAEVAGAKKKVSKKKVTDIEAIIHAIEAVIPPVTSFSIAGGTELSAILDVSRTLARRAERRVVGLHEASIRSVSAHTLAYLNRLSSLLFALARLANHQSGVREENPSYR